jgi:hypothetical protein
MARTDVENFLKAYAGDKGIQAEYKNDAAAAVKKYAPGATADEQAMLARGDAHEIKEHLKDVYGAALSVNIP